MYPIVNQSIALAGKSTWMSGTTQLGSTANGGAGAQGITETTGSSSRSPRRTPCRPVTDRAGAKIVKLATTSSLTVLCNLDQAPAITHAGDAVTVVAEGAAAQRQPAGVLLQGCAIAH